MLADTVLADTPPSGTTQTDPPSGTQPEDSSAAGSRSTDSPADASLLGHAPPTGAQSGPGIGTVVEHVGFAPDYVDYRTAWQLQRDVHDEIVAGTRPDTMLLLEHAAVYTAGKRTGKGDRPTDGTPVIDVDRGGKITWHGPGQLVGYPIVRLPDPVDVVAFVRLLEGALMDVCTEFGVATDRVEGRSGVWVLGRDGEEDRKVAAIGLRVSRGVTMHGFAINADCDLSWADPIIPCGIDDAGVTSLTAELGRHITVSDVLPVVEKHVLAALATLHPAPVAPTP